MTPPLVCVYTTGGTIASVPCSGETAATPRLDADALLAAVPGLSGLASLRATSLRQVGGSMLSLTEVGEIVDRAREDVRGGAAGVVVTQGTDSIEETSFALDLLWGGEEAPLVVTGAMRHPGLAGADGPANILAAVRVAASDEARGLGCVVVFGDEIHAPRFVRKTHTSSPATFRSWAAGPIGWVTEGRVRVAAIPRRPAIGPLPTARPLVAPPVALLTAGLGDDGLLLPAVAGSGARGLVIEAFGGGHLRHAWSEPLDALVARMPVVLASRTGGGEMLRSTYGGEGSETDLLGRGLIPAGAVDGLKARILLSLLLAAGAGRAEIANAFEALAGG